MSERVKNLLLGIMFLAAGVFFIFPGADMGFLLWRVIPIKGVFLGVLFVIVSVVYFVDAFKKKKD